uniref:Uncharacterized protein n=1 Tax=Candidatus Kentrum sp. LFY TaxID=2126342 RepID=A0A450UDQ9_9GAMM|nr:MAG: hypothetical protein BECKLFY1418B_GA0070995_10076 [Candidatus Kentron sp. LFY]VFJ90635.1 MAG: hypothetical protein BECKLFY1418A_GA0070994_101238 [Candidatus Kentron sp. LFY]
MHFDGFEYVFASDKTPTTSILHHGWRIRTPPDMQFLLDNRHDRANVRGWSKGFTDCDFTKIHG